ncbi:MipA/OmpV family protein [Massilia sp. R2A-15]|uniref:MipA/OmpV family protein n=1 Tax=Massilia sp. R2A-15 TaxID=3064278 RepID=UPI002736FD26|nr:MipA/OmpV family protein [Massilia sp. R2A-15]WLI90201.1 MipA/OmpV family protein [Massilia sp. R2A-15]
MKRYLCLALAAASGAAAAQTPALNRMPDGSRDLYLGLGAASAPRYEGASARKVSAWPVVQFEWSNGVFVSGASAGMHLSSEPSLEYGPLLALQPRRNDNGSAGGIGGVDSARPPALISPPMIAQRATRGGDGLAGMDPIATRVQAGAFLNLALTPRLRLTNNLLAGSGNARKGATWSAGLQHVAAGLPAHHTVALSAGLTLANHAHGQAFFGVSEAESARSGYPAYRAGAGIEDFHLGARWNWALAPAWLVTSNLQATRLAGSAKDSPLVQRPTNLTVSTALAYRF